MPAWALLSSVHQKARAEAGELLADAWGCRGARRERLTLQRGAGDQLSLSEVWWEGSSDLLLWRL